MCWYVTLAQRISGNNDMLVMALEKIPADIRVTGGVARMSDPKKIKVYLCVRMQ